jgi:hypothetical protein
MWWHGYTEDGGYTCQGFRRGFIQSTTYLLIYMLVYLSMDYLLVGYLLANHLLWWVHLGMPQQPNFRSFQNAHPWLNTSSTRCSGGAESKRCFSNEGVSGWYYQPHMILLDLKTQPLMLDKTIMEGLGLTNVNLEPCSYQILTLMGESKRT